ncbi:hypothetical protein [Streptomyces halobius]|uniref:Uncharacterized protein n=1 Tax=Streptomyces halobius TaxID=2879846 RepID=A0ABY4M071_9ACTN|nr:hypothetical protein [Streptomyces halobius]UQA90862.1 hypothetical protein K9S39_02285 [Streptomyces halobius]
MSATWWRWVLRIRVSRHRRHIDDDGPVFAGVTAVADLPGTTSRPVGAAGVTAAARAATAAGPAAAPVAGIASAAVSDPAGDDRESTTAAVTTAAGRATAAAGPAATAARAAGRARAAADAAPTGVSIRCGEADTRTVLVPATVTAGAADAAATANTAGTTGTAEYAGRAASAASAALPAGRGPVTGAAALGSGQVNQGEGLYPALPAVLTEGGKGASAAGTAAGPAPGETATAGTANPSAPAGTCAAGASP